MQVRVGKGFVGLLKKLGLSAEEVCEIGKWKSVDAFCSHYQRLGAQETLETKLTLDLAEKRGVHSQTSHRGSAEPEVPQPFWIWLMEKTSTFK